MSWSKNIANWIIVGQKMLQISFLAVLYKVCNEFAGPTLRHCTSMQLNSFWNVTDVASRWHVVALCPI